MHKLRKNSGVAIIDVGIAVVVITVFISLVSALIFKIQSNSALVQKRNQATSYAIDEIEEIKSKGYISEYDGKGLTGEEILDLNGTQNTGTDINIEENEEFTGYTKSVVIKDYKAFTGNENKKADLLKRLTVIVSFKFKDKIITVPISTYIVKE